MKLFRILIPAVIIVSLCPLPPLVHAAPPRTISYQGYLKNGTGKPVTGATGLTFRLYSSTRSSSAPLWSESRSVTPENDDRPGHTLLRGKLTVGRGTLVTDRVQVQ